MQLPAQSAACIRRIPAPCTYVLLAGELHDFAHVPHRPEVGRRLRPLVHECGQAGRHRNRALRRAGVLEFQVSFVTSCGQLSFIHYFLLSDYYTFLPSVGFDWLFSWERWKAFSSVGGWSSLIQKNNLFVFYSSTFLALPPGFAWEKGVENKWLSIYPRPIGRNLHLWPGEKPLVTAFLLSESTRSFVEGGEWPTVPGERLLPLKRRKKADKPSFSSSSSYFSSSATRSGSFWTFTDCSACKSVGQIC